MLRQAAMQVLVTLTNVEYFCACEFQKETLMSKTARFPVIAGLTLAMAAALVAFAGCGKEQPPTSQSQQVQQQPPAQAQAEAPADQPQVAVAATEQTTCPVMEGNPINKSIFVEYKGKKVYFCCKGCPETFLANPEKYIAKLPQFKQ